MQYQKKQGGQETYQRFMDAMKDDVWAEAELERVASENAAVG